jgi:hypothetical protein
MATEVSSNNNNLKNAVQVLVWKSQNELCRAVCSMVRYRRYCKKCNEVIHGPKAFYILMVKLFLWEIKNGMSYLNLSCKTTYLHFQLTDISASEVSFTRAPCKVWICNVNCKRFLLNFML